MKTIAILGATSEIARDLIRGWSADAPLALYSRRPETVSAWLESEGLPPFRSLGHEDFPDGAHDAVLNFVGSGDPARTVAMGAEILDITQRFDTLVLDYLKLHPQTRYIFLSSGAAYGATFLAPASAATQAKFPVNALTPQDYYGIAKLHAEARHRAMPNHAIIDIRVFAYFSRHSDIAKRFFVTDMLRAIRDGKEFETGAATMRRDFIAPRDFQALVAAALDGESRNIAIDTYSRAPVEKFALLDAMRDTFDLRYRIVEQPALMIATGAKPEYYSTHRAAAALGYQPLQTALESVLEESSALLGR